MLSAYVLILTEVGKVAHVAQALGDVDGVSWPKTSPAPTTSSPGSGLRSGSTGLVGGLPHPGRGWRYPHPDLHSDPPVAAEAVATTATPSSRCGPGNAPQM